MVIRSPQSLPDDGCSPLAAVVVVPPFLKAVGGPLLGPAMLAGAAHVAGYAVEVLDLNAAWLGARFPTSPGRSGFVGDHDRPSEQLRPLQRQWSQLCGGYLPGTPLVELGENPYLTLTYPHALVSTGAKRMAQGPFGAWVRAKLTALPRTPLLGLSVMYSGQVLAALAVSIVARQVWPGVLVVWGGAHVTALRDSITADAAFGEHVDHFVFGYAERTWVELVRAVAEGTELPVAAVRAGSRSSVLASDDAAVAPQFGVIRGGPGLTLPAQASRGCAYGRCTFCTYPAVEGAYRQLDLAPVVAVVALAEAHGACVAFKDSLVLPARLEAIAELVGGRLAWSACTKLSPRLDRAFLRRLASSGCATLEVGLETLTPSGQLIIEKRQTLPLFLSFLDAAAEAGIAVVVNYITGFPGADPEEERTGLAVVHTALAERAPGLVAKVEHNTFQLERMSPMGRNPGGFGLAVVRTWPWATVMEWGMVGAMASRRTA